MACNEMLISTKIIPILSPNNKADLDSSLFGREAVGPQFTI